MNAVYFVDGKHCSRGASMSEGLNGAFGGWNAIGMVSFTLDSVELLNH